MDRYGVQGKQPAGQLKGGSTRRAMLNKGRGVTGDGPVQGARLVSTRVRTTRRASSREDTTLRPVAPVKGVCHASDQLKEYKGNSKVPSMVEPREAQGALHTRTPTRVRGRRGQAGRAGQTGLGGQFRHEGKLGMQGKEGVQATVALQVSFANSTSE